ncbi:type II toxin-antitoxin system HipA family toxin [Luteimonas marina]|uniref:Type II toxin-antitoxin system HipA family toxin n=1 Tax=Luteimonas marina TaxID=488485 RepID=A0A5C5U5M3_9GAMM|nr:type II toxin-antitoxin system HipA family toxin [Luteimonas marina]TWT21099.1 type II toxin-antitoxin system HipA family toxin [Luteimonas marina]
MIERLDVELFGQPAGMLEISGPLRRPEDWTFTYHREYIRAGAPALSVTMPLREEPWIGALTRNWFCNLLPEGAVRQAIVQRLRIPHDDGFALLAAIGGECAGAVSLRVPGEERAAADDGETDLEAVLFLQGDVGGEGSWALAGTPMRLSLAGAQDKLAVVAEADGRLRLPHRGEPSTHILKPDSRRFRGLRDAEALGMALARRLGLDAAPARLLDVTGTPALLIERYDRVRASDGTLQRLHQEDFCQALSYPDGLKYEASGGPGLAACSALVRRLALGPGAVQGLLDWVVFNALIGNADAHAKNLSLLRDREGRRRLAPLYDLVPTVYLPESLVDRTPAMRIGEAARIDRIGVEDWVAFADAAGYRKPYVMDRVRSLAGRILGCLAEVGNGIVEQGGDPERVERVIVAIEGNTRMAQ